MEESFYILLNGEVSVWRHDKEIATVAPPNFLGEVGFILGDPRVATVKAASDKAYIRHVDCNRLIKMRVGKRSQDVSSVDHRFFRNRSKQTLMHSVL